LIVLSTLAAIKTAHGPVLCICTGSCCAIDGAIKPNRTNKINSFFIATTLSKKASGDKKFLRQTSNELQLARAIHAIEPAKFDLKNFTEKLLDFPL
jgi:hypothetical protein